ncbi:hypothetical protein HHL23_06370 [Chryseobacterium sp. RP-3-3]|uniref:Uncharacterized protein n=1 Tax=Chryseobacterium antibioticum TaxID=2728847 RepID=A0A7Y0FQU1_9FLAO|nr:hypothetical protein [Chryseobacterium antibioticum]NML69418.1 hypothetical protein [Chryseobacterium antibioticum]
MKILILTFTFFYSVILSQNYCDKDFLYENLLYSNNNIDLKEHYNSLTGEYSFVYCGTKGVQRNINFNVKLTDEEKVKLKEKYIDLKINNKILCIIVDDNQLFSSISITYKHDKQDCASNEDDRQALIAFNSFFLQIMQKKEEYKKALYWKYIKK